jgi:hypothetical protein
VVTVVLPSLLTCTVLPSSRVAVVLPSVLVVAGVVVSVDVPEESVTVLSTLPSSFTTLVVDEPSEPVTVVLVPLVVTVSPLLLMVAMGAGAGVGAVVVGQHHTLPFQFTLMSSHVGPAPSSYHSG